MCVYVNKKKYIYKYLCIYIYMNICIHVWIYAYMYEYMHICISPCAHACTHTCMRAEVTLHCHPLQYIALHHITLHYIPSVNFIAFQNQCNAIQFTLWTLMLLYQFILSDQITSLHNPKPMTLQNHRLYVSMYIPVHAI